MYYFMTRKGGGRELMACLDGKLSPRTQKQKQPTMTEKMY